MTAYPIHFHAHVITGAGRGRKLGVPTLNLDLSDVPPDLGDGVYAGVARVGSQNFPAAIHIGPRPTFNDTRTCEVHLIDTVLPEAPKTADVTILQFLRSVSTFPSPEALTKQMMDDIAETRRIVTENPLL